MGDWFRRSEGGDEKDRARMTACEQRLDSLERGQRSMRLEWEDVYDRLMKAAARLNQRSRRAAVVDPPEEIERIPVADVQHTTGSHETLAAARQRRTG